MRQILFSKRAVFYHQVLLAVCLELFNLFFLLFFRIQFHSYKVAHHVTTDPQIPPISVVNKHQGTTISNR